MKIALAQLRPYRGDILTNLDAHLDAMEIAHRHQVDHVFYPELSLTGYEPSSVSNLAMDESHELLAQIGHQCVKLHMKSTVGVPLKDSAGISISALTFVPNGQVNCYHKSYLHKDEEPFFVSKPNQSSLVNGTGIAQAICFELCVEQHLKDVLPQRPAIYLAMVAKTASNISGAHQRMEQIARDYGLTTMLVNAVGECEEGVCSGQSTIWSETGDLLVKAESDVASLIVFDTESKDCTIHTNISLPYPSNH